MFQKTPRKVKRQTTEWEKIFVNQILAKSGKGSVTRIYKELLQYGPRISTDISTKKTQTRPVSPWKMLTIISCQADENKSCKEIPLTSTGTAEMKKEEQTQELTRIRRNDSTRMLMVGT